MSIAAYNPNFALIRFAYSIEHPITWYDLPHLRCTQLTMGVAPTLDQATLENDFGTIARPAATSATYEPPLDLRGTYVEITLPSGVWVGYVVSETRERDAQEYDSASTKWRLAGGTQRFTAVGLEWFLSRAIVDGSVVYDNKRINRSLGYNTGWGDGRDIAYNDRGNKDDRDTQFAASVDRKTEWSAAQAIVNLLKYHQTTGRTNNRLPAEYNLHIDAYKYLTWFKPTIETAGHSVYQVLNEIASPSRGLAWWIEWNTGNNGIGLNAGQYYPLVRVTSMSTQNLTLAGNHSLPAADRQRDLPDLDNEPTLTRVVITKDDSRRADQVIVRGALRRAVFTVSFATGTLEAGWLASEEAAYIAGASGAPDYPNGSDARKRRNDRAREAQRFERVYQMFKIPNSWNGVLAAGVFACPDFDQSTQYQQGPAPVVLPALRLQRALPIRTGWDYQTATTPVKRDPNATEGEWQRPFAVVSTGEPTHGWRFAHAVNTTDEETTGNRKTSYHMSLLSGCAGFQLTPNSAVAHALGKNHYDPSVDPPSMHKPEIDYTTIRATICAEFDAHCEAKWPPLDTSLPFAKALTRVYVSLGDRARFDWLADGTIYDVQDGDLKQVATGGALRDDRELCEQIARIAYAWYAEDRASVTMEFADCQQLLGVGELITYIGRDDAQETVKALVTRITYMPEESRTELHAGFSELDFASLVQ